MASKIKGLNIPIGADATPFNTALDETKKKAGDLGKEMSAINRELKFDPSNVVLLSQKIDVATERADEAKKRLALLKEAEEAVEKQFKDGELTAEQYREFQREVEKAESQVKNFGNQVKEAESEFKSHNSIVGKLKDSYSEAKESINEFKEAHPKATKAMEATVDAAKKLGSALGTGLKAAAETSAAAIGAVSAGVAKIAKDSVEAYAEQEQLIGGMKKLYGEDAQQVIKQADDAFKTAGMDANEYMKTATLFSASLISGLGDDTKKAADYTDKAIRQMSDNANTFGTDIESLELAYKNFAKGNYTMLDNLSLGYAGSEAGMAKLISDSGVLGKEIRSLDGVTFDQMIDAIGVVQDKLNITGTTAKEANQTIEGSVNSAKSAYENLIAGLGNEDADVGQLVDNLIESGFTAFENITNRVDEILPSLSDAVDKLGEKVPGLLSDVFEDIVPDLLDTATDLVESLGDCLIESIPVLVPAAVDIVTGLVEFLAENVDDMIDAATEIVTTLVDSLSDDKNSKKLVSGAIDMVGAIVKSLIENAPDLLDAALEMGAALVKGLIDYDWASLAKSIYSSIKSSIIGFFSGGDDKGTDPKHAGGLAFVPYNGYRAELHEGEAILTQAQNEEYRREKEERDERLQTLSLQVNQLTQAVAAGQNQNFTVNANGSMSALVRMLDLEIVQENQRKSAFAR